MGEYSPAKTGEYPRIFPNFYNRWIINTTAAIWLRKYARIFVRGHYLFLEDHSFPRASLSENCSALLGPDNVRGQISEHIFAPNEGYCLYICMYIFVCMFICMNTCMYVCIYVCIHEKKMVTKSCPLSKILVSFAFS